MEMNRTKSKFYTPSPRSGTHYRLPSSSKALHLFGWARNGDHCLRHIVRVDDSRNQTPADAHLHVLRLPSETRSDPCDESGRNTERPFHGAARRMCGAP